MQTLRTAALMGVFGITVAGSLVLGVAAPASALVDYRDYQQTLPASVLDGLDVDNDTKSKLTNNTRRGVMSDRGMVPLGVTKAGPNKLFGGGGFGLYGIVQGVSKSVAAKPQVFDRDAEQPDWIDDEEWDACATTAADDWLGSFFDTARDWSASNNGVDCVEVRAGWEQMVAPDYTMPAFPSGLDSFPFEVTVAGVRYEFVEPFWDATASRVFSNGDTSVGGWVYPFNRYGTQPSGGWPTLVAWWSHINSAGDVVGSADFKNIMSGLTSNTRGAMFALSGDVNTGLTEAQIRGGVMPTPNRFLVYHGSEEQNQYLPLHMPYNTLMTKDGGGGTPAAPGGDPAARQVLLTTVYTEGGGVHQCRTTSFLVTAPSVPRPCEPTFPPDEVITKRTVELVPETDTGYVPGSNPTRGVESVEVPTPIRDWQRQYNGSTEPLLLDLQKNGVSCFDAPAGCADWFTDPNKESTYTCRYGGQTLALGECVKYAILFKPDSITNGQAYPSPGTSVAPAPGSQTSAGPAPGISPGTGVQDPTKTRQCFPTGWGVLNPFEWVFKPVVCAFETAFVPRAEAIEEIAGGIRDDFNNTSFRQVAASLNSLQMAIPREGGCGGIPLQFNLFGVQVDQQLLYTCDGPLAPVAMTTKSILTGSAIFATVIACTRYLATVFGFVGYSQGVEARQSAAADRKASKGNIS